MVRKSPTDGKNAAQRRRRLPIVLERQADRPIAQRAEGRSVSINQRVTWPSRIRHMNNAIGGQDHRDTRTASEQFALENVQQNGRAYRHQDGSEQPLSHLPKPPLTVSTRRGSPGRAHATATADRPVRHADARPGHAP